MSDEYESKWSEHGRVGTGRDSGERQRFEFDRRSREPEKLPTAPGGTGILGPPPEDSTYRCTANTVLGSRCRQWAMRGHTVCIRHAGALAPASRARETSRDTIEYHQTYEDIELRRLRHLPHVYARHLSRALTQRISDAAGLSDRLDLTNELDLFRATALDAAHLYDATLAEGVPVEARHAAGQLLRDVLDQVGKFVERFAHVEATRKDVLPVGSLHVVVTQIATMAHDVFGEDPAMISRVREFSDRLRELRLPGPTEQDGTDITPDMQVQAMDDTIPTVPSEAA